MSDLVSGEAVVLELRVARVASRGLAFALDVVIQFVSLYVLLIILVAAGGNGFDDALTGALSLVVIVGCVIGYPVAMETLTRGRTVGKMALGLRVVRTDGGPVRFRQALVRALAGFFVDFWALGLAGVVALVVSTASKKGQRVGDMLAGTLVIRERVPRQRVPGVYTPPPLAAWAAQLPVGNLPNDLALAIRQYLARLPELSPGAAANLGYQLSVDVSNRLGAPVPPGMPPYDYLGAILNERRNREEARYRPPVQPQVQMPPLMQMPMVTPDEQIPNPPDSPFAPPS